MQYSIYLFYVSILYCSRGLTYTYDMYCGSKTARGKRRIKILNNLYNAWIFLSSRLGQEHQNVLKCDIFDKRTTGTMCQTVSAFD